LVDGLPRRAAALSPSDPLPLAQAQRIYDYVRASGRSASPLAEQTANLVAGATADATLALSEAADRQLAQGRWLVPGDGHHPGLADWVTARHAGYRPELQRAVTNAAAQGNTVQAMLPRTHPTRDWPRPRDILADALAHGHGQHAAARPGHPRSPITRPVRAR
jgi:hypothetical protein